MTKPEAAPLPTGRTAYLVLGMHRSGTSAVTQLLALAGAELPANVMPGDQHNERGYFEPWKIAMFNDRRLRAGGGAWDDVFGFPHRGLGAREEKAWLAEAVALFQEEYGQVRWPLMKDPRVSVLLPFWRRVLERSNVAARCVIPVRHPLAVAGSLARRDGFAPEKSLLLWSAYMLASEAYSRDLPRAFVDYDSLLADWRTEAARIETAHGAPMPRLTARAAKLIDKFLSPELRHNAADGGLAGLGWAGEIAAAVHDWFAEAAADGSHDPAPLEAAGRELSRRAQDMGVLVSPVARDLDIARSELHEAQNWRRALEAEVEALRRERAQIEALVDLVAMRRA